MIENDLNTIESDRVSNLCHQDQDYAEPRPAFSRPSTLLFRMAIIFHFRYLS